MSYQATLAGLMLGLLAATGHAADGSSKDADIRQLMKVTGGENLGRQFAAAFTQQMGKALKASRPDVPERAFAVLDREVLAVLSEQMSAKGGLMDQLVPIYDRHFSAQELKDLLAFYATPLGQKTIAVMPKVMGESMAVGQRWGQGLAPEIEKRVTAALRREGLLPAK